jgi:hypothetical protein
MLCLVQCYWLEFLGNRNLNFELFGHFPFVLTQLLNTKLVSQYLSKNLVKFGDFWLNTF